MGLAADNRETLIKQFVRAGTALSHDEMVARAVPPDHCYWSRDSGARSSRRAPIVAEIEKIAGAAEADAIATVELSDANIRITLGNTALTSKLINGTFSDYTRVIPSAKGREATLDTSAMRAAIDRVSAIASERGEP